MPEVVQLPTPAHLLAAQVPPPPRRRPAGGAVEVPPWPGPLPAVPPLPSYRGTYEPNPCARYQLAASRPRTCDPLPLAAVMLDRLQDKASTARRCDVSPAMITMLAHGKKTASPRMRELLEEVAGVPAVAWQLWSRPSWRAPGPEASHADRLRARRPLASAVRLAEGVIRRAKREALTGAASEVRELVLDARALVSEARALLARVDPPRPPAR